MFSIGSCVWKLVSQLVTLFLEAVEPLKAWDLWRKQVTGVRVSWEMKTYSPAVFPDSPKCKCSVSHSWRLPFSPQLTVPSNCKPKQTLSSNKPGGVFCQVFETRKKKKKNAIKFLSLAFRPEVLQRCGHWAFSHDMVSGVKQEVWYLIFT